jgi:hypothetical protein
VTERAVYLGLQSNVRFFASHHGFAKLTNRLKGLSLLYDGVILQDGIYEAWFGDTGSQEFHGPLVDESQLKPVRNRVGAPFGARVAETGTNDFHTVVASTTVQRFRAQFVSIARETRAAGADWFTVGVIQPPYASQADDIAKKWDAEEQAMVGQLWPKMHPRVRTAVLHGLNLDLAGAAVLGVHLAPDGLHQPLLLAKASLSRVQVRGSGERALWIVLPEVAKATWDDIKDLRRDKGLAGLRAKLADMDQAALEGSDIYAGALADTLAELENTRPRWFASGLWAVVSLMSGALGPTLTGVGIAASAVNSARADRRWTAALLRARQRLRRSAREQDWLRLS